MIAQYVHSLAIKLNLFQHQGCSKGLGEGGDTEQGLVRHWLIFLQCIVTEASANKEHQN